MDKRVFGKGQIVTAAELNSAFTAVQSGFDVVAMNGVQSGLRVDPAVIPDLTVVVSVGVAFDTTGQRIAVIAPTVVDCSAAAVVTPGNSKWIAVVARFVRALSDQRVVTVENGGDGVPWYWEQNEGVELIVREGAEEVIPTRPAALADDVVLAYVFLVYGQTEIVDTDIYYDGRTVPAIATVLNFGADVTGVLDSSRCFQGAFDTLAKVFIPDGLYRVQELQPNSDQIIVCESQSTVIEGVSTQSNIFHTQSYTTGLVVDGGTWRNCRRVWYHDVNNSLAYSVFRNMWVLNCEYGFDCIVSVGNLWDSCFFAVDQSPDNMRYGLHLPSTGTGQTNINRIENCAFLYFAHAGVLLGGGAYVQTCNVIRGCWFEDASGPGIEVLGPTRGLHILDTYFESLGVARSIVNSSYQWALSGSGTNEYYLQTAAAENPDLFSPDIILEDSIPMVEGALGSLAAGEWVWGDNDALGYSTVYVRLTDNSDPDTKADGWLHTAGAPDIVMGKAGQSVSSVVIESCSFKTTDPNTIDRIRLTQLSEAIISNCEVLLDEGQTFCAVLTNSDLYSADLYRNYLNVPDAQGSYESRLFRRSGTQPVNWVGSLAGVIATDRDERVARILRYPNGVVSYPERNTHNTAGASSGTTETPLSQYNIPANSLGFDGGLRFVGAGKKTGVGGNKTVRLRFGRPTGLENEIQVHPPANNQNDWRCEVDLYQATIDVLGGNWSWVASGSGTNEYYLQYSGGNPSNNAAFHQPGTVYEALQPMVVGVLGSLAAGEWVWGDNDALGYSTVYVRLTDNSDPDVHDSDPSYVRATHQRYSWVGYDGSTVHQGFGFAAVDLSLLVITYVTGECAVGGDQVVQYNRRILRV